MLVQLSLVTRIICMVVMVLLSVDAFADECQSCTKEEQTAEYKKIYETYRDAVNAARQAGFQCAKDSGYSDPGGGNHAAGNCADWQGVTWRALAGKQWRCWTIIKIEARQKFSQLNYLILRPPVYHHFVSLTPKCGGKRIYLDPWATGVATAQDEDDFPFATGFFSWWTHYPQDRHLAGSKARTF